LKAGRIEFGRAEALCHGETKKAPLAGGVPFFTVKSVKGCLFAFNVEHSSIVWTEIGVK